MKTALTALPVLALLAAGPATAAHRTLTVTGRDDAAVDRPAIQAAIDAAQPGDTVLLEGTFQLDGTPVFIRTSHLTVAGRATDDDGDGDVNEDRPDGLDDDGDGLVDEDGWNAVLRGVGDGSGGPARDAFPLRFNDGFEILGLEEALEGITIRDLELRQVNRGIYLFPDYDDGGTVLLCDAAVPTAGELARVTVQRNAFVDGFRGVEILGRVETVRIHDNRFSGLSGPGVLLFGQQIGCAEPDASIVEFLPLGTPRRTDVARNRLTALPFGLLSFVSDRTTVRRNLIQALTAGVASNEDEDLLVIHNEIAGAFIGVLGFADSRYEGPSSGNLIWRNTLRDHVYGFLADCLATGYTAINNEFSGALFVDVLLDGTAPGGFCAGIGDSFGNTVIATRFPTSVLDYGTDNRLLGSMISVPEAAAAALRTLGTTRAEGGLP